MVDGLLITLAAFAGSFVESVEALTIVLAVGLTRGWRAPLEGAVAAIVVLALLCVALGSLLLGRIPERGLKGVVGVAILLFGARWLRKAVLRGAGVIPLHDEEQEYRDTVRSLSGAHGGQGRDWRSFSIAFNGTFLEGVEVVFIVVAVGGSGGRLVLAAIGGIAAAVVVAALGFALRHPLARVPENLLKLSVGVMLTSLGTFWTLEGMGYSWPLDAGSIVVLAVLYSAVSAAAIAALRRSPPVPA